MLFIVVLFFFVYICFTLDSLNNIYNFFLLIFFLCLHSDYHVVPNKEIIKW